MANLFPSTRLALLAALVLMTSSCGYELPTAAVDPTGTVARTSWISARAEGEYWNALIVNARREGDYLVIEGTMLVGDEGTSVIRLEIKAEAGALPQVIDSLSTIAASIVYDPVYQARQVWIATRTMGGGTVTVTSLSATGATGTFSFTGRALTTNTVPQDYRVTEGAFDVRF